MSITAVKLAGVGEVSVNRKADPLLTVRVAQFDLPFDSPVFNGHFPDQPIVPGVVLLDWVASMLGHPIDTLDDVRFIVPVTPGDHRAVEISFGEGRTFSFLIRADGEFSARGRGRWAE